MTEETEKIYVIPLKTKGYKASRAAPTAMKRVKQYLSRHMKTPLENIWIDDSLNKAIWSHGKYKMQSKIRVKAVKFEDGVVEAYLPELEFKKSKRELLQEEREKKQPILIKEEEEEPEEEVETGAEEYEIAPTADGEVKIKKKKTPRKEKKETGEPEKEKEIKEKPSEETAKPKEPEEKPVESEKKKEPGKPKTEKPLSSEEKTDAREENKEEKSQGPSGESDEVKETEKKE